MQCTSKTVPEDSLVLRQCRQIRDFIFALTFLLNVAGSFTCVIEVDGYHNVIKRNER